jgi:hypothetical protein
MKTASGIGPVRYNPELTCALTILAFGNLLFLLLSLLRSILLGPTRSLLSRLRIAGVTLSVPWIRQKL